MNDCRIAIFQSRTFFERMAGLLVRPPLNSGEALYLAPCSSIHTCFMRYPIDIAFVDRDGRVLKTVSRLLPWRAAQCWRAYGALELRAGELDLRGIVVGKSIDLGAATGVPT